MNRRKFFTLLAALPFAGSIVKAFAEPKPAENWSRNFETFEIKDDIIVPAAFQLSETWTKYTWLDGKLAWFVWARALWLNQYNCYVDQFLSIECVADYERPDIHIPAEFAQWLHLRSNVAINWHKPDGSIVRRYPADILLQHMTAPQSFLTYEDVTTVHRLSNWRIDWKKT